MDPGDLGFYDWSGRTIERHRAEIRRLFGFREFTVADGDKIADWLAVDVAQRERPPDLVREQFLAECRARQLEPPTPGQVDRIVGPALNRAGEALAARIVDRLDREVARRLLALVSVGDHDDSALLRSIKATTGDVSLKSMLVEIDKLESVRSFRLPVNCEWGDLAYRTTKDGVRVVRQVYEIRTFEALCDQLKCKGIWVEGAKEFCNPDEDLGVEEDRNRKQR